jgi:hypothetical protein
MCTRRVEERQATVKVYRFIMRVSILALTAANWWCKLGAAHTSSRLFLNPEQEAKSAREGRPWSEVGELAAAIWAVARASSPFAEPHQIPTERRLSLSPGPGQNAVRTPLLPLRLELRSSNTPSISRRCLPSGVDRTGRSVSPPRPPRLRHI